MSMKARHVLIVLVLALGGVVPALACNYTYTVIDGAGRETIVSEGSSATLRLGETYTLRMEYHENHRNCNVSPEETLYLLDGSRWRLERETQPLYLLSWPQWEQPASRTHRGEFVFTAAQAGTWLVEVVRVCDRGGYHGEIYLEVRS